MSKSSLKKDAVYVYFGYFLRYLSVIILIPYYGHVLGPTSYGKVLAAMSLMSIVWMTVNYGFSTTGARELALAEKEANYGHVFGRQIMARFVLMPIGIAIGAVGTYCSPTLSADPWYGVLATALGLLAAMNLGWFFQGLRKFRTSIMLEAIGYPLNVVLILLMVKGQEDGIYALAGLLMSSAIYSLFAYAVAFKTLKGSPIVFAGSLQEIKGAGVIFLQSINSMLMTTGSTYLLSALSTPLQVGYFGSAERLISFALAFLGPAGQLLMPTIAHRTLHAPDDVQSLTRRAIIFELGYGLLGGVGGFLLAPYMIPVIFGHKFMAAVPILQIMVWSMPFAAFTHAFGSYVLIPHKKEKWLVTSVTIGNVFNLIFIALLTRSMGGIGVSIARVAGECLSASMLVLVALRFLKKKPAVSGAAY